MKIALVFPPSCDPTSPYISVPLLTGFLRSRGVDVLPVDANVEAFRYLLTGERLKAYLDRARARFGKLDRKPALDHEDRAEYAALYRAISEGACVPSGIDGALRVMSVGSGESFYDRTAYRRSVEIFSRSLALVSAVHSPLELDFSKYRSRFSLLSRTEVEFDARADRDPFNPYYTQILIPKLRAENVGVAGISVVFPGQVQPAFSLALLLKKELPDVHVTVGGPAATQFFDRLSGAALEDALSPFHTAVCGEGERALLDLVRRLESGERPSGIIAGGNTEEPGSLPPPDFDGLPLSSYFSPEPVLPYDAARGCYWNRCAFCHYGLSGCGTAPYRERPVEAAAKHLIGLSEKYGARLFYLSQDTVSPKYLLKLSGILKTEAPHIRWSTDIRAEPSLTPEACRTLAEGGGLSVSLGIESGSDRVLSFMDKGIRVSTSRKVVRALAGAGIAAEVMCFTGFPTETFDEAMTTINFLSELESCVSLFMCGEFALTHGSRVAREPEQYDVKEIWEVAGDEYRTALFYATGTEYVTESRRMKLAERLDSVSEAWAFGTYPWAGSLSTAHTQLWYDRYGADVFRRLARDGKRARRHPGDDLPVKDFPVRYDPFVVEERSAGHEGEIWNAMINGLRRADRETWKALSRRYPVLRSRGKPRIYR